MAENTIEVTGTGIYRVPKTGGSAAGATIPVRILKARRSGTARVDLLVEPVGGSGAFWIRQSSLVNPPDVAEEEEE